MTPFQPSFDMCDDHSHQHEDSPDPLDEFLARFLVDIPEVPFNPITTTPASSPPPPQSSSISGSAPAPPHTPNRQITCQWVSPHDPPFICGTPLSPDSKHVCTHFRHAHDVRGNEKVTVCCHWRDCQVPPMQRGSLIRHVLAVHLGLLRWRCEACGRVFSRRGTVHAC